eukprot:scaffold287496_cov30-Tisochrysis_lutea.AAC.1
MSSTGGVRIWPLPPTPARWPAVLCWLLTLSLRLLSISFSRVDSLKGGEGGAEGGGKKKGGGSGVQAGRGE